MPAPSLDIFCRVIDNYGDAGVCGRLARQWSSEQGGVTRLYIDDPSVLAAIMPAPYSFDVIAWDDSLTYTDPADMVIETFACNLPDHAIVAITKRDTPSVWIDLEYLSAEDWVGGFHAIPSTHPTTGGKKTVFFPGFTPETGGLLREKSLISRNNAFMNDVQAQNIWRKSRFLPEIDDNCIDISLFCYKTAPENAVLELFSNYPRPIRIFRPERRNDALVATEGNLTTYHVPFVPQDEYDLLCWTSDLNFVRGEDSFVRAQFAAKPLIWNIYVQDDDAHLIKMRAFLDLYLPFFDEKERDLLAQAHNLWNERGRKQGDIWHKLLDSLPSLTAGARRWTGELMAQDDLATQLLQFYAAQTQKR